MNPISYALQRLRFSIPLPILEKTFISLDRANYRSAVSLDTMIRNAVIEARVMPDCNLIGGTETTINITGCDWQTLTNYSAIVRIPKSLTQNRSITCALGVCYGNASVGSGSIYASNNSSQLLGAATGVLNAASSMPLSQTADVQLIGENVIHLTDNLALPSIVHLRCWLENDKAFNHLQPTSHIPFANLVEYAVKSYIYNKNVIEMDRAYLSGGQDLNSYRTIIEGYSDAEENYRDYFHKTWRKVSLFNDNEANRRHLRMVVGGLF